MTITAGQSELAAALRRDGASALEAAIVLSAALEFSDAWMHELRGPGGKWASSPGSTRAVSSWESRVSASPRVNVSVPVDTEAIHQRAVAEATALAREHTVVHVAKSTTATRAETRTMIQEAREKHGKDVHTLIESVRRANQRVQEAQEKGEDKRSRIKLAVHLGAILAGAVIAYLEARLGLGFVHSEDLRTLIEIGSASAPIIAQELADWKKRL